MIGRQFRGPPNSGNGGYVCGVLADGLDGVVTSVIRAPVPLDVELGFQRGEGVNQLLGEEGVLLGEGKAVAATLPEAPPAPTLDEARAAGGRFLGHQERIHPPCFTCSTEREEGEALRVFPGQLDGAEPGVIACAWTPHAAFGDAEGRLTTANLWAAMDCPGFIAWCVKDGRHGALLGTMTGEVLERPKVGEACIILAWPISREGRKEFAGVALYGADGRLMARAHQVWIVMGPRAPEAAASTEAASA